jgi:diguanylate cyclase (GGDEF)-like protein
VNYSKRYSLYEVFPAASRLSAINSRPKMIDQNAIEQLPFRRRTFSGYQLLTLALSLIAIGLTYAISVMDLDVTDKAATIGGVVGSYLCICILLFWNQNRRRRMEDVDPTTPVVAVESALSALDEASDYFTGSLRSDDALRLVASKVREVIDFRTIVLFLLNESRTKIVSVHADGEKAESLKGLAYDISEGLAGQVFTTRQVEVDSYMQLDEEQEFGASVAIPLRHGENVFGVLQLFFDDSFETAAEHPTLFESIGSRVAPLMLGSIAFERTQANALTDATTDLPNERAFYLVLETQVAEAHRNRDKRPLTILAMDIKGFDEINCTFGHAAGDRVLNHVARGVKDKLRQMDFFARALNDEFLAILPTADSEMVQEIIERIRSGFSGRELSINETQQVEIELNIGWSAFGSDGETPGQLMSLAQLRKEQMKSVTPNNVLWFPREAREPFN